MPALDRECCLLLLSLPPSLIMGLIFLSLMLGLFQLCCCDPFLVTISTAKQYSSGEDVICKVTFTNTRDSDYYLLKRNTPLDEISSNIFSISEDGHSLNYDGLLYQRKPPTSEEYVLISAKSSISSAIDLSLFYPISKPGALYSVNLESVITFYDHDASNTTFQHVVSNKGAFFLYGDRNGPRMTKAEVLRRNASLIEKLDIDLSSFAKAGGYRIPAMAGTPRGDDITRTVNVYAATYGVLPRSASAVDSNLQNLYTSVFGLRYSGYMDTVKGAYLNIQYAMEQYQFTIYFDGPECFKIKNVIAYTYKGSTVLYVCSLYRNEPDVKGTDTKLGTIVHELSHAVAYTDDIVYGKTNCLNLARSSPSQAIKNADNYHYFSEPLAQ